MQSTHVLRKLYYACFGWLMSLLWRPFRWKLYTGEWYVMWVRKPRGTRHKDYLPHVNWTLEHFPRYDRDGKEVFLVAKLNFTK